MFPSQSKLYRIGKCLLPSSFFLFCPSFFSAAPAFLIITLVDYDRFESSSDKGLYMYKLSENVFTETFPFPFEKLSSVEQRMLVLLAWLQKSMFGQLIRFA